MNKKIIFTSGGTGGHIFPAINLMKHFSDFGHEVLLVTDKRGKYFLDNYNAFRSHIIMTDTPTNKKFFFKIFSFFKVFFSIINSVRILIKEKPDLIMGFGGYVSFPICFSSIFFNIPLVIYENNLVLGRTNKILLPFSKKFLLAKTLPINFPYKYKKKVWEVGSILNKKIMNYSFIRRDNKKKNFTILVLGGSQGAEIFGKIVPPVIEKLVNEKFEIEIIQQCTKQQEVHLVDFYKTKKINYSVFSFTDNILDLISKTDLAISRCGASTTAELVQTLTPFIAVPYPYSIDNHQFLNAKYYEEKGCCWIIKQEDFNSEAVFELISKIIKNRKKLENIRENMKKNDSKNAYVKIEKAIKEFI